MSRERRFVLLLTVSGEFRRQEPERAEQMARAQLHLQAMRPLKGPRGGRYESVGLPFWFDWRLDPMRDAWDVGAKVQARYVRPPR